MVPIFNRLSLNEWMLIIFVYTERSLSFIISLIISIIPFIPYKKKKVDVNEEDKIKWLGYDIKGKEKLEHFISPENEIPLAQRLYESNSLKDMLYAIDPNILLETHIVKTQDDYLLQIHRIPFDSKRQKDTDYKGIVYLQHGLMMCSNIWLCHSENPTKNNLPLYLNSLGYDVWMGNNRGNRYSNKNLNVERHSEKFWNFSLDEFAIYDIPDSLHYILNTTSLEKKNSIFGYDFYNGEVENRISIVAFSQGSAQIFASLSLYPDLNSKVISFVALSPALTPPGLFNKFVDNIVKLQPQLLFLFFGKKILLPTATTLWPKILPINLFNLAIKYSTLFLFNWENKNINKSQTVSFKNLYSPTSVKCIVHWFQILKTQNFQMFVSSDDLNENNNSIFEATPFPTRTNIKVPLLLVYGTNDSLVDIETLKKNLPEKTTFELPISKHEHLDIIWGDDVYDLVSTKVADFLNFWRIKSESIAKTNLNINLIEPFNVSPRNLTTSNTINNDEVSSSDINEDEEAMDDEDDDEVVASSEKTMFREELFNY